MQINRKNVLLGKVERFDESLRDFSNIIDYSNYNTKPKYLETNLKCADYR